MPVGAVGELCLSGYQLAEGYLNRPEENEKAFIENPFDDDEGYDGVDNTGHNNDQNALRKLYEDLR